MAENGVTLDSLRAESERRYADYPITLSTGETVTLRAPLRLDAADREHIRGIQQQLQGIASTDAGETPSDESVLELLRDMIRTCAADGRGQELLDEVGDDLALMRTLFEDYMERAQVGEASDSVN